MSKRWEEKAERDRLKAQLEIAVEALQQLKRYHGGGAQYVANEALARIKEIGE